MPKHKISVVTASYNIEEFIAHTIKSVVDPGNPGLEYIVIDGASTDGTFAIAKRFEDRISTLISERDAGQYYAIEKGLSLSSGSIMSWINADDIYFPWTISTVLEIFEKFPEVEWITGLPSFLNEKGQLTQIHTKPAAYPQAALRNGWYTRNLGGFLQQESMFWRRSLWEKAGGLNTGLSLAADFELWTKFAQHARLYSVSVPLAAFRERLGVQRSSALADKYDEEVAAVASHLKPPPMVWRSIASKGIVARNLARLLHSEKAPAIMYDRSASTWKMVDRRRSISRVSYSSLLDANAYREK